MAVVARARSSAAGPFGVEDESALPVKHRRCSVGLELDEFVDREQDVEVPQHASWIERLEGTLLSDEDEGARAVEVLRDSLGRPVAAAPAPLCTACPVPHL